MSNYVLLERVKLNASTASVVFSNIPQTGYTDLKIVYSAKAATGGWVGLTIKFNGSSTTYSDLYLQGLGNSVATGTNVYSGASVYTGAIEDSTFTNLFNSGEIYIPNYNSASSYKSFSVNSVTEAAQTTSFQEMIAGLWSQYNAITSISLVTSTAVNLAQYSTISLYGLATTGTTPITYPQATGGDIIKTDGTYWYHAFLSSGIFAPLTTLSCDILTIAGGGSGGNNASGGGGAGGLLYSSAQSVNSTNVYAVTIGAGGANQTSYSTGGFNGNDSTFSGNSFTTLTAIGGGAGQGPNSTPAGSGGSGGGAAGYSGTPTAGTGTSGQGNNGGTNAAAAESSGGGGAGAVGGNGGNNSARTGVGGAGLNTYSSWASATGTGVSGYYAGGGGGGAGTSTSAGVAGGAGGGGTGAGVDQNTLATAGTINTGSGGGGSGYGNTSASSNTGGGSGIVIVRYAV